jgi:amino acid permease
MLWGIVFTLLTAVMAVFSLWLLGELSNFGGPSPTLHAIGVVAGGKKGGAFTDLCVCANNIGAMISYLVIASTSAQTLAGTGIERQVYVMFAVVLISPLCLVKRVNTLRFTSTIALCALTVLVIMIVLFAMGLGGVFEPCDGTPHCGGEVVAATPPVDVITQFVIFTNGYGAILLAAPPRATHRSQNDHIYDVCC